MKGHDQAVFAGHPGHLGDEVPPEGGGLVDGDLALAGQAVQLPGVVLGQEVGPGVDVAVVRRIRRRGP